MIPLSFLYVKYEAGVNKWLAQLASHFPKLEKICLMVTMRLQEATVTAKKKKKKEVV